ncbi:MAG: glycosyltransferase family 39 protein [Planctomycetaceae bacterium]|nr:glycosyltransferase family 39 protein [Planctomycetaceae bacterium]
MMRLSWLSMVFGLAAFLLSASMINHGLVESSLPAGPGLTLDESFNIDQGVYLADAIGDHGPLLFAPETARKVFGAKRFLPDHPPLGRVWLGIVHQATSWFVPGSESTVYNVPAARLGSCLALAFMVILLTEYSFRVRGTAAALGAGLMLLGMPHLVGHARLAALESCTNLAWVVALLPLLSWWTSDRAPTNRQAILSGVCWGLLLLTKVQGILLPPAILIWAVLRFREQAIRPLLLWGIAGAIVFFVGWPWLWQDPVGHTLRFLGRTTDRQTLYCWYFGERYADKLVPWHFPFVTLLFSFPAWWIISLLLRIRQRLAAPEQLMLLSSLIPLCVFAFPGIPVYDGTRLFLIVMPACAMIAGRGFETVWNLQLAARASHLVRAVTVSALAVIPLAWTMQPFAINQYGVVCGGNRGAARLGMEACYWSDALNSEFWKQIPEGTTLAVAPVSHQFQLSDLESLVPIISQRRIKLVPYFYEEDKSDHDLLLIHRLADLRPELQADPPGTERLMTFQQSGVICARVLRRKSRSLLNE